MRLARYEKTSHLFNRIVAQRCDSDWPRHNGSDPLHRWLLQPGLLLLFCSQDHGLTSSVSDSATPRSSRAHWIQTTSRNSSWQGRYLLPKPSVPIREITNLNFYTAIFYQASQKNFLLVQVMSKKDLCLRQALGFQQSADPLSPRQHFYPQVFC